MKISKKWKRFWTMDRHHAEGFTLVELIVVIAILAILGGVAVPAYSGYVKKAERAADEALLAEINTAFASACMINGENNYYRKDVSGGIENKKFVYAEPFSDDFDSYFESEAVEFKVIQNLLYDMEFGGFRDPTVAETLTLAYGDGYITMTREQIDKLLNSTYYGEGMSSEKLLNQLDTVVAVASYMGSVQGITATEEYAAFALSALGLSTTGNLSNDQNLLALECERLAKQALGLSENSELTQAVIDKMHQIQTNALVLYTAQCTSAMTQEDAKNLLNNVNSDTIYENITNGADGATKQTGMNQAALAYGMYYAYVNSDACTDTSLAGQTNITAQDVTTALDNNTEFKNYIQSQQGQQDMDAYLAALGIINSSTNSTEAVEKLVVEGFCNNDLNEILNGTFGK